MPRQPQQYLCVLEIFCALSTSPYTDDRGVYRTEIREKQACLCGCYCICVCAFFCVCCVYNEPSRYINFLHKFLLTVLFLRSLNISISFSESNRSGVVLIDGKQKQLNSQSFVWRDEA